MEKEYCVYVHTNRINGLKYVGITSNDPKIRWKNGSGYASNQYFSKSIKKYGWDNFDHEILFSGLTKEVAEQMERMAIASLGTLFPNGYNFDTGGNLQKAISEETRQRLRESHKGQQVSEERKAQLKTEMLGANNPVAKAVNQYLPDGTYIATFVTGVEAERNTGVNRKDISSLCHHKYGFKLIGGYQWRFASECPPGESIAPVHKDIYTPVALYLENGELFKTYNSIVEASADTGLSTAAIQSKASRYAKIPNANSTWRYIR